LDVCLEENAYKVGHKLSQNILNVFANKNSKLKQFFKTLFLAFNTLFEWSLFDHTVVVEVIAL
jgi:hypothetical protein